MKEAIEQGLQKGIERGIIEIAKNLLSMNLSDVDVIKATGLIQETIADLKAQI